MIKGIHHVGLAVRDLGSATAFLKNALGLHGADAPTSGSRNAYLCGPNVFLNLTQVDSPGNKRARPVNEAGITHVCIQARDIETLRTRLAAAGATFHSDSVALGTGNLYCYARDLERNVIEIEGIPFVPPEQPPWVAHVAIATPDVGRLSAFYAKFTGASVIGSNRIGPNPLYDRITGLENVEVIPAWIVSLNLTIELWQFVSPRTEPRAAPRPVDEPGYTHIAFETDDLETDQALFSAAGGALDGEPVEKDGCRLVFGRDPDGNAIRLIEFSPSQSGSSITALEDKDIVARMAELRRRQTGS